MSARMTQRIELGLYIWDCSCLYHGHENNTHTSLLKDKVHQLTLASAQTGPLQISQHQLAHEVIKSN